MKYFKLIEQTETMIHFKILSKCSGVPYCDTFSVEDDWIAISPAPGANCCIVRVMMQLIFYKSTIFKSKILAASIKAAREMWQEWGEWMRKRN